MIRPSSTTSNNKSESIDFEFFENEDCLTKVYGKQKQGDSSKFITKAVIETKPQLLEFPAKATIEKHPVQHFVRPTEERLSQSHKETDCLSSPSSSLDRKLLGLEDPDLENLLNCLAYNDERYDGVLSPHSFQLKESSDNSLTDSTVTTITSDFTSISPLLSSTSLSSSSCESIPYDDHDENSAVSERPPESEMPNTDTGVLQDLNQEQSCTLIDELNEFKEISNESNSLNGSTSECDDNDERLESQDENSNSSPEASAYESDFESYNETKFLDNNREIEETVMKNGEKIDSVSDKESRVSTLEDELGDISITQSRSSSSIKTSYKKRKNCNLTFSREELIRIERDNLILLKKIMAQSKHKPVSLNQPYSHKKTSTAINRAKLQKKIAQDNYVSIMLCTNQ